MLNALVPIKKESERLPNKNFLNFCGQPLYREILDTLQNVTSIRNIIINTDSDEIANDCLKRYDNVIIYQRPNYLLGNEITMNSIIHHDIKITEGEHFLQTHVTNPLLSAKTINKAIELYFENLGQYDSLLSVESIKKRGYDNKGNPINHNNNELLQTQHLPEINIENSNIFIFSKSSFFKANNSRVGLNPKLFYMSAIEGIDIDFENDFKLAELIKKNIKEFKI